MKTIFFILLITFSISNAFLFRGPFNVVDRAEDNGSSIEDFLTAEWAHFGLKKPEQAIQCYDQISAKLYFKYLEISNDLVQHSEGRDKKKVHKDFVKILALGKALEKSSNCAAQTQDFQDLFNALNITDRNPELLGINSYIHFQANFGEISQQLPEVLNAIKQNNFSLAGDLNGALLNLSIWEIHNQGTALLALKGLWNGVHIGLDLPDAESILECWNNETAGIRLQFDYGMAEAVAKGKPRDAVYNTERWYEEKGKELISKIPEDAWKCWANSTDTKRASEKLGIDISSHEFFDKAKKWILSHQEKYWKLQWKIKKSLEEHNFIHGGSAYGKLIEKAAKQE